MPHDKNGQVLQEGDRVLIEAVVTGIYPSDDFCNLNLSTVEPMFPSENPTTLVLNTRQVEKVDKG